MPLASSLRRSFGGIDETRLRLSLSIAVFRHCVLNWHMGQCELSSSGGGSCAQWAETIALSAAFCWRDRPSPAVLIVGPRPKQTYADAGARPVAISMAVAAK